jgi:hypothetical protein
VYIHIYWCKYICIGEYGCIYWVYPYILGPTLFTHTHVCIYVCMRTCTDVATYVCAYEFLCSSNYILYIVSNNIYIYIYIYISSNLRV